MVEPTDMIVPMLKEMREENRKGFSEVKKRLVGHDVRFDRIEERRKSFSHALAGDSLMSKMLVGDWEERIEALEKKVKQLERQK
jgi:archaellum component FlaC